MRRRATAAFNEQDFCFIFLSTVVWTIMARWSLSVLTMSSGNTGRPSSIRLSAVSMVIRTPVRPIPALRTWFKQNGGFRFTGAGRKVWAGDQTSALCLTCSVPSAALCLSSSPSPSQRKAGSQRGRQVRRGPAMRRTAGVWLHAPHLTEFHKEMIKNQEHWNILQQ